MQDGKYEVYCIEFKTTHVSKEWGNPKSKIVPYKEAYPDHGEDNWGMCGPDYWGKGMDPLVGKGNDRHPRNRKSHDELYSAKMNANLPGFYSLKYAVAALKRICKLDEEGEWDSIDSGYGNKRMQRCIHKFRIIRIVKTQKTEVMETADDVVRAL